MTAPSLLGMEWTSWRHFARSIFFHSSRMTSFRDWMLDREWCSTCLFRIPHRCSIGFRSGDILEHWITFTPFFFRNPTVALDVCLGSLSCYKSARRPRARSDGSIFSFSIEQYRRGFFRGRHPCMLCSVRRILWREIVTPVWLSTSLDNCSELACRFSSTLLIRRRSWRGVNFRGRPGRLCEMVAVPSFLNVCTTFATVFWLISKALLIFL